MSLKNQGQNIPAIAEDDDLEQGSSTHGHGECKKWRSFFESSSKILESEGGGSCIIVERENTREKGRQVRFLSHECFIGVLTGDKQNN